MDPIPAMDLTRGMVYRVSARNIRIAVYAGENKFVGIREKFGERFLEIEVFGDTLNRIISPIAGPLPKTIVLDAYLPPRCRRCRKLCWWTGPPAPAPWACRSGCATVETVVWRNRKLFRLLNALEKGVSVSA